MDSRIKDTIVRHDKGFNCAQAVACTYCDLLGYKEEDIFRMTEGFIAPSLFLSPAKSTAPDKAPQVACIPPIPAPNAPKTKGRTYQLSKTMVNQFREKCGSTVCCELKGIATGTPIHSCADCIMDAAAIVENVLFGGEE